MALTVDKGTMVLLPNSNVWDGDDEVALLANVRAWRVVIEALVGSHHKWAQEGGGDEFMQRAGALHVTLKECESHMMSGVYGGVHAISQELAWVLDHAPRERREMLLVHYAVQLVEIEYEMKLEEYKRLSQLSDVDPQILENMRQQLIAEGDRVDTLVADFLRMILEIHPGGAQRIPADIRQKLVADKGEDT